MLSLILTISSLLLGLVIISSLRLAQILSHPRPRAPRDLSDGGAHLLIVLGSGGHTAEMIAMLERAFATPETETHESADSRSPDARVSCHSQATTVSSPWKNFTRRTWIVSSGDAISAQRATAFEEKVASLDLGEAVRGDGDGEGKTTVQEGELLHEEKGSGDRRYEIHTVPRAREIHQPLYTAPFSSLRCAAACARVLLGNRGEVSAPDLILCNGPATAAIVIFTSILLRFLDVQGCHSMGKMRTVYVESWARVERLSLSGWLLCGVVDRFLVQWPQLAKKASRAEFSGVLV